jgi:hypothetical protein
MAKEFQLMNPERRMEFRRAGRPGSSLFRQGVWTLLLAGAMGVLAGCASPGAVMVDLHPLYKPDNIYLAPPSNHNEPESPTGHPQYSTGRAGQLPGEIKRVAVLPVSCAERQTDLAAGRDALEPILLAELIKTKHFEVVQVSRDTLWRLTGRTHWTGEDILPANLFDALTKECGCDAVLFSELTEFRAYPPLVIGWRLKLVDVRQKKTLWAGDEHFDAGNPAVVAGARHYQRLSQVGRDDNVGLRGAGVSSVLDVTGGIMGWFVGDGENAAAAQAGGWLAANSPRQFGQYSIDSLLGTLPAR